MTVILAINSSRRVVADHDASWSTVTCWDGRGVVDCFARLGFKSPDGTMKKNVQTFDNPRRAISTWFDRDWLSAHKRAIQLRFKACRQRVAKCVGCV